MGYRAYPAAKGGQKRAGLEGPWTYPTGKTLYYDPAEGKYYDASSDQYMTDEEMAYHYGMKKKEWK